MSKFYLLLFLLISLLVACSCSAGLTFTSDDNTIGITGYDGNNTIDFSALSGGTGCDQSIGNITAPTGSVGIIACNETITLTSDDASVTIRAWDGNNTIDFAAAGVGGGCADVFKTINAPAGTDPVASGCANILNLTASLGNITITGNAGTDTIDLTLNASVATDVELAAMVSDAAYGAGWNGVTTIAPSKNAVYDTLNSHYTNTSNPHSTTLDQAYEAGQTITADVADLVTTLNAAGIDFIVNANAATGDFILQDGGTQRFALAASGVIYMTPIGSVLKGIDIQQTCTSALSNHAMMDIRMAITSGTLNSSYTWNLCFADIAQNNAFQVTAARTAEVTGHYYQAKWAGAISDSGTPNTLDARTWAFRGYAEHQLVYDTGTQNNILTAGGLYLIGYNKAGIWKGGGTDTLYAYGANLDAQMLPYVFSGTANAYSYGVKATAILTPQFSSSINNGYTYGVYCSAQGAAAYATDVAYGIYATAGLANAADDNWAGYFYRNIADSVPVVMIEQDNTGGLGACLELKQDDTDEPFIDLTGTSSADSSPSFTTRVRVELNGVDYYWYLDPV